MKKSGRAVKNLKSLRLFFAFVLPHFTQKQPQITKPLRPIRRRNKFSFSNHTKIMKAKILTILAALFLSVSTVSAQMSQELVLEKGVTPHAKIDDVYRRFGEAYKKLDVEAVTNLYTDDAFYLSPGGEIQRGRATISKIFNGFLNSVIKDGGILSIKFRILERRVSGDLAYDVGIYTLTQRRPNLENRTSIGKFVVVALRMKNGEWRFQVDSFSDIPNNPANNQNSSTENGSPISQVNLPTLKRELEMQYAKIAEANKNKNLEQLLSLRTSDFTAKMPNGETWNFEQSANYSRRAFEQVREILELSNTILSLEVKGDTVAVVVQQKWRRMQMMKDKLRLVETGAIQRETWIKTPTGWRLKLIDEIRPGAWSVDGKRVDPSKPYDPDAPNFVPPTEN